MAENKRDAPAFDLKDYRQAMVTSIGIILGFLVGFLGNWVTENSFSVKRLDDSVLFFGSLAGSTCLFISMFRMLNVVTGGNLVSYYRRTLYLYIGGVVLAFVSILLSGFLGP